MTNKLVVIINSLKVPKIKKILVYELKFLVSNYSCLQNPCLGGYHPQIPVLSVLNWICWTPPPRTKFLGTPLLSSVTLEKSLSIQALLLIVVYEIVVTQHYSEQKKGISWKVPARSDVLSPWRLTPDYSNRSSFQENTSVKSAYLWMSFTDFV